MENKINITEILKDCPKGMKLYSPIYGEIELLKVNSNYTYPIIITIGIDSTGTFTSDGRLYEQYHSAKCILFPSREMRDWTKFFKRGDVAIQLFYGCGVLVEEWTDDSYTSFKASVFQLKKGGFAKRDKRVLSIDNFVKASDEQRDMFISNMEKFFGGKYNPETLQVEPVKPECPFEPFDKVLVRDDDEKKWRASLFAYYDENAKYPYVCIPYVHTQCIPYNEHTAHLLGTTDPYTEGGDK